MTASSTEAAPSDASPDRRVGRRWTVALVVVAALVLAASGLVRSLDLPMLGAEDVDPQRIADAAEGDLDEAAKIDTLATVHGYLNWVIWGGGVFEPQEFATQVDTAVAAHAEAGHDEVVTTLRAARDAAAGDLRLVDAHDLVEEHEYDLRGTDPPGRHPAP